ASIEKILNYLSDIRETLNLQENYEFEIEKLNKQYEQAIADYSHHALQLSENRKKVARQLETTVQQQLAELGMPRMRFQ
ncbi:hypothetical protein GWN26_00595, partial [Candidatus Saccharibacteria bacterium]|nr:hypothetical protein [Candidatus Saccharibacteria bacterium]NIW78925.1 hypothetical protein [Calditrichia bacterium]